MGRKIKSLLFGSAPDTTIYHAEHRSKKGRKMRTIEESKSPAFKRKLEKIKKYEENHKLGGI